MNILTLTIVVLAFSSVEGWFVKKIFSGDDRNCFCKAYDANTNQVLLDFGSIQKCHGWPTCACRRHEMISCADNCDHRVEEWVKSKPSACRGRYVKKHYKASTCSEGFGHERRLC